MPFAATAGPVPRLGMAIAWPPPDAGIGQSGPPGASESWSASRAAMSTDTARDRSTLLE